MTQTQPQPDRPPQPNQPKSFATTIACYHSVEYDGDCPGYYQYEPQEGQLVCSECGCVTLISAPIVSCERLEGSLR